MNDYTKSLAYGLGVAATMTSTMVISDAAIEQLSPDMNENVRLGIDIAAGIAGVVAYVNVENRVAKTVKTVKNRLRKNN